MRFIRLFGLVALASLSQFGTTASAADLLIYDDDLRNGFANGSWGNQENLANTVPVHGGARSIRFLPTSWDGVSFLAPGALSSSNYRGLSFWVHGGASGAQKLRLFVNNGTTNLAQVDIETLLGSPIAANTWTHVEVSFDAAPFLVNGSVNQVYVMDWRDGNAQTAVYFDDFVLLERGAPPPPDAIFSSSFEAAPVPPPNGIVIEPDVNVGGFHSDRYTWFDSRHQPRSAAMVRNNQGDPAGHNGGYLRQLTYRLADLSTRTVTGSFDGHPGFGYVVSHFASGGGTWGVIGYDTPGQFRTLWGGRHHAIHRYTQSISMNGYPVAVTIDWAYFTGRDHPVWAITYDMSAAPVNVVNGDSRSPYGDMTYDGAAPGSGDTVMGVAWGDRYQFITTNGPLSRNSAWSYAAPNTVPYAYQWTQTVDAEMGMVQTQTITQQDAGGYWGYDRWGGTSATGLGCASNSYRMPCDWNWPYQINQYSFLGSDDTTISKRMAWGTNFGFLGQASYPQMGMAANRPGYPRQSYSLYIVLDRHSLAPNVAQRAQVETTQGVSFSASVGSVLTQGPAGAGRTDTQTYAPSGYNHVYGTWEVNAVGNAATVALNVASGNLRQPILVLRHYTSNALPSTVRLNGVTLVQDVDYFPSIDDAGDALWLTLDRSLSGANALEVVP